jgi:hypothetical protein
MTVFDVYLNGRKICRAGVGEDGVLTAIVTWARLTGTAARTARRLGRRAEETNLQVGGLADDTHRRWAGRNLKAGDRVTVAVVKANEFDAPIRQQSRDPRLQERQETRYYRRLKRKYDPAQARTTFLNVDLDIWSRAPLEGLVEALGTKVVVLRVGEENGRHGAHLEHAESGSDGDVDRAIRRLVRVIDQLPPAIRSVWNRAQRREFNVGIQSGMKPHACEFRVEPETLEAIARINARLALTVYGTATNDSPKGRTRKSPAKQGYKNRQASPA